MLAQAAFKISFESVRNSKPSKCFGFHSSAFFLNDAERTLAFVASFLVHIINVGRIDSGGKFSHRSMRCKLGSLVIHGAPAM
ncbi:Hypothetical protein SRM_00272 [Salinibacter ruber M8]|uniref:Uncharacterized protein n=1 Tax=Salinibacter ruber (strain M8) TaxID=761659 RepID=D5H588_SALRM|nr:Hypothetical protein SRM_00272 [Salinibacter ruber M8]